MNSADLTLASVTRATANSGATVNFILGNSGGSVGSGCRARQYHQPASFTAAMVNSIVPWAAVNGQFATYVPYTSVNGVSTGGVGVPGTAGYPAYDSAPRPAVSRT